jgi:DNA-binding SARP family transcriptional activator
LKVEIKLFGQLQISELAGSLGAPLRQRAARLLAYLLLHPRAALRREQAAFTLWPDTSEEEALATLRRALSDLRAALPAWEGGDWVVASSREIHWNVRSPYQLDVDEYERLVRMATPVSLRSAAALYTGDLLPELDDEWVLAERERLRQVQLDLLHRLVLHHRTLREYNLASDYCQAALALDPLAEAIHRELIAIRYETGDRAGALAAYERFCAILWDELGVKPMPETQSLARSITQGESLSHTAPALQRAPVATTRPDANPPPIGREPEAAQLSIWWKDAFGGKGSLAILSGEVGVGKGKLVGWLIEAAAQSGGLVLAGPCYQFEQTLPYQPMVEMLRSAVSPLEHTALLPAYRALLARLVPEIVEISGQPGVEGDLISGDLRLQLYEAMLQAFLTLAREQPLLLAFEHLHWAAESTLDWLTYAVPRLPKNRILIVATCRSSEIGVGHPLRRLEQRFSRDGSVRSLRIQPYRYETTREWIARESNLTGSHLDQVTRCLFEKTGGNLFFLQELVCGLQEAGQILVRSGAWSGRFVDETPCAETGIPETLRAAVLARIERLDDLPRKFLKTAAVAGDPFSYEVIRRAEQWSDDDALDALDEIIQRGFVREGETPGEYELVHHLVGEAIYANISPPRRTHRHRVIANALGALHPDSDEALAYHYERAGDAALAAQHHLNAAERAVGLGALSDAAAHFESALRLWPEGDPPGRAAIAERLAACTAPFTSAK